MSGRATRPRSRRGRHAPPGELDPVAESSEEAEAASGSSELGPVPSQESCKPELLGPEAADSGHSLDSRTDKEADGDSSRGPAPALEGPHDPAGETHQAPTAAPQEQETIPSGPGAPSVFQTLQQVLSSLEAAAAAWRCQPPSCPGPTEVEGRIKGEPRLFLEQEGAGGFQREAAHLAERNAWLRLALGSRENELIHLQASLEAVQAEKETLQREVQELQDSLLRLEPFPPPSHSQVGGPGTASSCSGAAREPWAARDPFSLPHPLLRRLQSDSSAQISGALPCQPLTPELHMVEAQMEQLRGSIEKLKCFNRLLSAVLQGYKGQCEGLSMQLGRWEAEATALRLALQYSERCEEVFEVLLTLREADSGAEIPKSDLEAAEKEAQRLLAQEEAAMDGETRWDPQPSPKGSSVDRPTLQEVATQLQGCVQHLQERRALVKIPPKPGSTLAPMPTVLHAEALVQAIVGTQPSPALPRLEKMQIQQDLETTRGSALPGGSRGTDGGQVAKVQDPEELAQELSASLARALGLWEQLQFLREELEQVAQKGRARRAQSAKLNSDLCKAHRALVLAFRGAQRKQEEQRRKLEQQVTLMQARQTEELAVLEATIKVLGRPRPPRPPPRPGETFL
ncbi:Usher syndrome type-1C protein-binding protein 1 isoform X5 [Sturnira hondurensis]|uniref:Usher syndrome type-1C protein-binding protein 1 isoform X5 n=1 Tax=Sturnira hondurensis TaxID=192404 RepID=UPI001879FD2C|nr:Usher syndrome type-1C protein-binding protein 1 isoform X5 [Sturnira hondurensis]